MDSQTKDLIIKIFICAYPVLFVIGAIGNTFSFIIFSRKAFKKTFFSVYFRFLAFTDTFTLLYTINDLTTAFYSQDLQNSSYISCKLFYYLIFSVAPISGWLLVIVSLDRMLTIVAPKKYTFKKVKLNQIILCVCLFVFNFCFYIPKALFSDYEAFNSSDNSSDLVYECVDTDEKRIVGWMDLFNSTLLPFFFMIVFTSVTISTIFKSRMRIFANTNTARIKQKDIKFAITTVTLSVSFFLLNLPLCLYNLFTNEIEFNDADSSLFSTISIFFFYSNFAVVFYVNLITNSIFRKEFLVFVRLRKDASVIISTNNHFKHAADDGSFSYRT